MNYLFMTSGAMTVVACAILIVGGIIKLARVGDDLFRLDAKLNLILKEMGVAFPPRPSAGVQAIARSQRIAAIKAYREETGLGLKQAMDVIDQWRGTR